MAHPNTPLVASVTEVIDEIVDVSSRRVLDVGCGTGALVRWLAERGARATGVETQSDLVDAARNRPPVCGERYLHGGGESLPLADEEFDVVIFSFSLHHVPGDKMRKALAEARRVLVDGGIVVVVEPVADGDYFEVVRIVDDETRVRRLALDAVSDLDAHGLEPGPEAYYRMHRHYSDPERLFEQIVRVDPDRAPVVAANRDRLIEKFYRHGRPAEEGYRFEMEIRSNLLVKSSSQAA